MLACWSTSRCNRAEVLAGERLAVIEAMKMENVLFATQDGVVEEMLNKGESCVDQPILSSRDDCEHERTAAPKRSSERAARG